MCSFSLWSWQQWRWSFLHQPCIFYCHFLHSIGGHCLHLHRTVYAGTNETIFWCVSRHFSDFFWMERLTITSCTLIPSTLCYVLPFFLLEFPQKMLRDIWSRLTNLEVSYDFPDTLKSTGGLYWGVSTIFSHFWLNYFYAVGKNAKIQFLRKFVLVKIT